MKYYTLAIKCDGREYTPEGGGYSRAEVLDELRSNALAGIRRSEMCIVSSGDTQFEIDARIVELNENTPQHQN